MRCVALFICIALFCSPLVLRAEPLRVALYTVELDRNGPGLLLRDILKGEDPQIAAAAKVIAHVDADILVLLRFDYDYGLAALSAFAQVLADQGSSYGYHFALRPNSGMATGLDMDGDGRTGDARDAQGYGRFAGHRGMAVLSKFPIETRAARDFSGFLWKDLPGAVLPQISGKPFPSAAAQAGQRLSSTAHWEVPVRLPSGQRLNILAFDATPPLFDGPEDRNGLRNRDEIRFWPLLIEGVLGKVAGWPAPDSPFVLLGNSNLDPTRGDGLGRTMADVLAHPGLQDPKPSSLGAPSAHPNDTVHWPDNSSVTSLRVDYVLPSSDLRVVGSGVFWPAAGAPLAEVVPVASRHQLVWIDLHLTK